MPPPPYSIYTESEYKRAFNLTQFTQKRYGNPLKVVLFCLLREESWLYELMTRVHYIGKSKEYFNTVLFICISVQI